MCNRRHYRRPTTGARGPWNGSGGWVGALEAMHRPERPSAMSCDHSNSWHRPLRLVRLWSLDGRAMATWEPSTRNRVRLATRELGVALRREIHPFCMHVKGHGGVKGAVRLIQRLLPRVHFVARFDIASYYRSIRHDRVTEQLRAAQVPKQLRALIDDYLRLPDRHQSGRGLVASGGLSPLLGALHLVDVDRALGNERLRRSGVHYLRYMDDFLILTRTRWQLRRAIATLRQRLGGSLPATFQAKPANRTNVSSAAPRPASTFWAIDFIPVAVCALRRRVSSVYSPAAVGFMSRGSRVRGSGGMSNVGWTGCGAASEASSAEKEAGRDTGSTYSWVSTSTAPRCRDADTAAGR